MSELDRHPKRGPTRWIHYLGNAALQGTAGLWRTTNFLTGKGLVGMMIVIIAIGAGLGAALNVAWLIAAAVLVVLAVSVIGGYRVWSETEHAYTGARRQLEIATASEPKRTVPDAHRIELQQIAAGLETYLAREKPVRYHPPGQNGSAPVAYSFRQHFPELAEMLDDWNKYVERIERSRSAMREWIAKELDERGIAHYGPLDAVITNRIEVDGLDALEWSVSEGQLFITGFAVASVSPDDDDVEQLKEPVDELLAEVSETTQALLLRADRELLDSIRENIRGELERIRAMHVIRGRCELCA